MNKRSTRRMQVVTLMDGDVVLCQTSIPNTANFLYSFIEGDYFDRVGKSRNFQRRAKVKP